MFNEFRNGQNKYDPKCNKIDSSRADREENTIKEDKETRDKTIEERKAEH